MREGLSPMRRYEALDSMRGLAAFTVMMEHLLFIYPLMWNDTLSIRGDFWINLVKYSPLRIFHAGHEAVVFFFVLSGFVLAMPFFTRTPTAYSFLVKRILRIYPGYYAAILLALIMRQIASPHIPEHGVSTWYEVLWRGALTPWALVNHALLIGEFDFRQLDITIWSLTQEMRVALIFPLVVLFVKRVHTRYVVPISLLLVIWSDDWMRLYGSDLSTYLQWTPEVLFMFVIGVVLAKHRDEFIVLYGRMKPWTRVAVFMLAITVYPVEWWQFVGPTATWLIPVNDATSLIGVVVFIWFGISSVRVHQALSFQPIAHLGRVSYGFYLIHPVVYFSLVDLLYGHLSLWLILCIVPFVSWGIATVIYHFVEEPFIEVGRRLARRMDEKILSRTQSESVQNASL